MTQGQAEHVANKHAAAKRGPAPVAGKSTAGPGPASALDLVASKPALSRPDDILKLQRTVGNRAVNRLLAAQDKGKPAASGQATSTGIGGTLANIQRMPAPADISKHKDKLGRTSKTVKQVRSMLADYHASQIPYHKIGLLNVSKAMADMWLKKHGDNSNTATDFKKLISDADQELPGLTKTLVEQKKFADEGEKTSGGEYLSQYDKKFGYRGRSAQEWARPQAKYIHSLAAGGAANPSSEQGMGLALGPQLHKQWQQKYQLSEAELTAIKTYTAGTYRIINSALTGNEGYLGDMISNTELDLVKGGEKEDKSPAGLAKAKAEAYLHAGQIDKAIAHIVAKQSYTGTAWRGDTYPVAQMETIYKNKVIKFPNYLSTSKSDKEAKVFVAKGLGKNPNRPLGVLWKIQVTKGADITDISISPFEQEVLLPRNTTLQLLKRKKRKEAQGEVWEIEARQAT